MMNRNLCKKVITEGGSLTPLIIPSSESKGLGLMNPSIFVDAGKLLLNLRNINYTLYHCEKGQTFNSRYGPLAYLNPENDIHLRTFNFMCELGEDLSIKEFHKVDTSKLDVEPLWEFVGLEDARVVRWDGTLYIIGCRRDTTFNGVSRMELSEIVINEETVEEISRSRIAPPNDPNSYCEKNWMPVLDMPFHFVKWTNPTEVVKVDVANKISETVFLSKDIIQNIPDLRGSSQVLTWGENRFCIVHDVNLFKNKALQKDAIYMHRFVVWNKDWHIVHISEPFSFMTGEIEFCCGMAFYKGDLLITFGFQDNAAFVLRVPEILIEEIIGMKVKQEVIKKNVIKKEAAKWRATPYPTLEITTSIPIKGCPNDCVFCPQRVLAKAYSEIRDTRVMTFSDFQVAIDKVPIEVGITFAGFTEPFLNKSCSDMIVYAHESGHRISVFTTAVGMTLKDVEKIKDIPFASGPNSGFALHLPDKGGYSKHNVTQGYINIITALQLTNIQNFYSVCMGTIHEELTYLFPNVYIQEMWSRAGNLKREMQLKPGLLKLTDKFKSVDNGEGKWTCNCLEKLYHNVLLPNGDVSVCCMDYSLEHIIGNLYTQDYNNILPELDASFDLCRFCENAKQL